MSLKIGVVIPLYNHEKFISQALQSVLQQTRRVDEIVLIDDGSRDDGFRIANDILMNVPGAKVIKQNNQGAHNAINHGISLLNTDIVAILNSDDIFFPEKIERSERIFLNDKSVGLIFGGICFIDDQGKEILDGVPIHWIERAKEFYFRFLDLRFALANENFATTTSNFIFRKKIWEEVGGFSNLRYCHDLDFILSVQRDHQVFFDNEFVHIKYRIHGNNTISEKISLVRLEVATVIAAALVEFNIKNNNFLKIEDYIDMAKELYQNKNMDSAILMALTLRLAFSSKKIFYDAMSSQQIKENLSKYTE